MLKALISINGVTELLQFDIIETIEQLSEAQVDHSPLNVYVALSAGSRDF